MSSKKPTFSSLAKAELHQTPYFISLFHFLIYFYYFFFIFFHNSQNTSVITPFLPTEFSRVSARKTGQPGPSQHDPTKPRHIEYSQEEGPGHIFQGLTKFD
jgi:hypothetical protein